ncbi:hypothetical protein DL89DRAFT_168773 [Linderina pennispora]|uniref:Uncharacterized protein n=1 Tax=Linderina pennispora TaxID=61395 RepID=A0A1Y1W5Z5_9FUNG|nr:uncharacterized protein DL89DRAFT_168773 [Linderina pennispora]ORX68959.1 hypothetical protein DL89DRAFT_168773 [Linderina pennispora]
MASPDAKEVPLTGPPDKPALTRPSQQPAQRLITISQIEPTMGTEGSVVSSAPTRRSSASQTRASPTPTSVAQSPIESADMTSSSSLPFIPYPTTTDSQGLQ